MRAVVQRVSSSRVETGGSTVGAIEKGFCVLLGVTHSDTEADAKWLAEKIVNLRIFEDDQDKLNLSLLDVGGSMLIVSQFTLYGDCRKGRRPSVSEAAPPQEADRLYEYFSAQMRGLGITTANGRFGSMMKVSLLNDGPVTLIVDTPENPAV